MTSQKVVSTRLHLVSSITLPFP